MNDKRHLLRRVTAFTTAFVFLCRFASAGVAGAAEVTGSISTGKASSGDGTSAVMPVTQAPSKAEPSKGSSAAVTGKSSS